MPYLDNADITKQVTTKGQSEPVAESSSRAAESNVHDKSRTPTNPSRTVFHLRVRRLGTVRKQTGDCLMWPWEHLAFGYVLFSLLTHLHERRAPRDIEVLVLAFVTQLPDLIDKPLAWVFGILPGGQTFAHSLLFAVPLILAVSALTRRYDRSSIGLGVAVGYLSHLAGDIIYKLLISGEASMEFLLWPVLDVSSPVSEPAYLYVKELFTEFLVFLSTPRGTFLILFEFLLVGGALGLWLYDGMPGTGVLNRNQRQIVEHE